VREEESGVGGLAVLRNVGKFTKDGDSMDRRSSALIHSTKNF
jgi:hypothetical protein